MQSRMSAHTILNRLLFAFFATLICAMPASAEIYRCTVGGRSVVQDRPCDAQAKQEVRKVWGGADSFEGCYRIRYEDLERGNGLDGDIRVFRNGSSWFMSRIAKEGGPNEYNSRLREGGASDFSYIKRMSGQYTSSALLDSAAGFALFRSNGSLNSVWGPQIGSVQRISCPKRAIRASRR